MMIRTASLICLFALFVAALLPSAVGAQQEKPKDKVRDGLFEVTLKSAEEQPRKMIVDELVRDRDLNPGALYRVKTGGYLGFEEKEWVDKIEFKVFDKPVTELPEYKRFSSLLVEINRKTWDIKDMLGRYDLLAMRLLNICGRHRFSDLQAIDENILQQLTVYRQLILLRALVVNALNRFVTERSCRDKFKDYNKTLNIYSKQLAELSQNYERLSRRALRLADELVPGAKRGEKTRPEDASKAEKAPAR